MKRAPALILVSDDEGLIAHWKRAIGTPTTVTAPNWQAARGLPIADTTVLWLDLALKDVPARNSAAWGAAMRATAARIVATSSSPQEDEAMLALDAGCAGYCHAYSDTATLKQVQQVVKAGNVWIGKNLMQRLLQSAARAAPVAPPTAFDWAEGLTLREKEVAILAANGASNQAIAADRKITERTVKAHLSAVFTKLNVTDRLQLALRVHGIG